MGSKGEHLIRLLNLLVERFNEDELRTLCFHLELDYEDLGGEGKRGKARELVLFLVRHGRIAELASTGRLIRPDVAWDIRDAEISPPTSSPQPQRLSNITGGSVIVTHNQLGGQVAHSITNIGSQPRSFSQAAAERLIEALRRYPPETYDIFIHWGDIEAQQFARKLEDVLSLAGWKREGFLHQMFPTVPQGIIVEVPVKKTSFEVLLEWLNQNGLKWQGTHDPKLGKNNLIVGTNV